MAQRDAGSQPSRVPQDQGEGWRWCWMPWRRLGSLPVPLSPRSKIPSIAPLSAHPPAWPSRIGHIPMRPPSNNSTANISKHQLPANGQDIRQQSFYRAPRNQSRAAPGVLMTNHSLSVLTMEFAQGFPTEPSRDRSDLTTIGDQPPPHPPALTFCHGCAIHGCLLRLQLSICTGIWLSEQDSLFAHLDCISGGSEGHDGRGLLA